MDRKIELWEKIFLPLINDYEEMEYFITNDSYFTQWGSDKPSYYNYFFDPREIFQKIDEMYKNGYNKMFIYELLYSPFSGAYEIFAIFLKDE